MQLVVIDPMSASCSESAFVSYTHIDRCKSLAAIVDTLSQTETDELFKIIHTRHRGYTRNNNGIFLNLTWLDEETLCCIEDYVRFCTRSRTELHRFESLREALSQKNTNMVDSLQSIHTGSLSSLENDLGIVDATCAHDDTTGAVPIKSKLTSSGRFALYKKRFAKQYSDASAKDAVSDLKTDGYICT